MKRCILSLKLPTVIIIMSLIMGCSNFRITPFDYPTYPNRAMEVGAIEGYQSKIAEYQFSMYERKLRERYASQHLAVQGSYLYAAQCGLTIFDISSPKKISILGTYDGFCGVDDLFVAEGQAYLAARDKGLIILDIKEPTQPFLLASYEYDAGRDSPPASVAALDDYIYLYTPTSKLSACHKSIPESECKSYKGWHLETPLWQVLHLQAGDNGSQIRHIKNLEDIGRPRAISGNFIYTVTKWQAEAHVYRDNLQTVSILNRKMPEVTDIQIVANMVDLKVFDDILWGSTGNGFRVWDVSTPQHPQNIEITYNTSGLIGSFGVFDVNDFRVVGEGYSLTYHHQSNSISTKIDARFDRPVGAIVVDKNYVYSPYIVTDRDSTLSRLGIKIYEMP